MTVPKGAVICHEQAGGGGYGDPRRRDRQLVQEDIADGKITRTFAERHHGYREPESPPPPSSVPR
jgi:N-methylhydantoinase B